MAKQKKKKSRFWRTALALTLDIVKDVIAATLAELIANLLGLWYCGAYKGASSPLYVSIINHYTEKVKEVCMGKVASILVLRFCLL